MQRDFKATSGLQFHSKQFYCFNKLRWPEWLKTFVELAESQTKAWFAQTVKKTQNIFHAKSIQSLREKSLCKFSKLFYDYLNDSNE